MRKNLPMHWKVAQIGNEHIGYTSSGGTPNRSNPEYFNGEILWVKSGELNDDYIYETEEKITQDGLANSSAKLFPAGTLLIAMYGATAGKTAILGVEATTNQAVCAIFPKGHSFKSQFLQFYLIYIRPKILSARAGGAQPNINQRVINSLEIVLPPLSEQKEIACTLKTIKQAKETRQHELQLEQECKAALMQHLFTYGTHNEPLKPTEIGNIPESWEVASLEENCSKVIDCPHSTPKFCDSGVLVVRNFNIRDGRLNLESSFFTSQEEYIERTKRCVPQKGDVLFSREAPIGEACLVPANTQLSLGQRTMLLRTLSSRLNSHFLVYAFYSPELRTRMLRMGSGVTAKHLNVADVRRLKVPIPHLDEQQEIAIALQACDTKISTLEQEIELLEELFRAMLEELMTGHLPVMPLLQETLP